MYLSLNGGGSQGYEFLVGNNSGAWVSNAAITFVLGKTKLISAVYNGTNFIVYNDANTTAFDTDAVSFTPNDSAVLRIGAGDNETTAGNFFKGRLGEIIYFNRALKAEERQAVEQYLAKKWDIN